MKHGDVRPWLSVIAGGESLVSHAGGVLLVETARPAVEALPVQRDVGFLHRRLIALLGLAVDEFWLGQIGTNAARSGMGHLVDAERRSGVHANDLGSRRPELPLSAVMPLSHREG